MVAKNKPTCLSMEGFFHGNYLKQISRYSDEFVPMPGMSFVEKYGLYIPKTPSLIITSKSTERRVLVPNNTNTLIHIISYLPKENLRLLEEFLKKTGLDFPYKNKTTEVSEIIMPSIFTEIVQVGKIGFEMLSKMA